MHPQIDLGRQSFPVIRRLVRYGVCLILSINVFASPLQAADLNAARSLLSQGNFEAAEAITKQAISQKPSNIEARLLQGVIQANSGRLDDAIDTFRQVTLDHPELPQAYNNLAAIHAGRGEFEQAREILIRAIQGNPSYPVARENLGDLYANMAQIEYQRALMLQEANPRIREKIQKMASVTGRQLLPPPQEVAATITNRAGNDRDQSNDDTPTSGNCLLVGPFKNTAERSLVENWLSRQGVLARTESHTIRSGRTMVYLEGGPSRESTKTILGQIRQAGISDTSVIRRANGERAISLGVFSKASSVERRLRELHAKGFSPKTEATGTDKERMLVRAVFQSSTPPSTDSIRSELRTPDLGIKACP